MSPKGYSSQGLVADALGTHDGVVPVQMLEVLLEAAENWIDKRTSRGWLGTSVTSEPHTLSGEFALIWLRQAPVVAVTAVTARTLWTGSQVQALPTTAYELMDPQRGKVLISSGYYHSQLAVSYTTSAPVPADIQLAATLLVAAWARPMIVGPLSSSSGGSMDPSMMIASGIKSYAIGQDLSVTFQDSGSGSPGAMTLAAPVEVLRLVDPYRMLSFA